MVLRQARTDARGVDVPAQFGASLRRLREESGRTQEDLGHAAGVHPVEISRMEAGKRDAKLSTLVRLADELDVTLDALVGRG
jgi:transcriptional regulator with XRE-family HTH domain